MLMSLGKNRDNNYIWLAILGMTSQFTDSLISKEKYLVSCSMLRDQAALANPPSSEEVDDDRILETTAIRLPLMRHWSLYEAFMNSDYVAGKLSIWTEIGKDKFYAFLAQMGWLSCRTFVLFR